MPVRKMPMDKPQVAAVSTRQKQPSERTKLQKLLFSKPESQGDAPQGASIRSSVDLPRTSFGALVACSHGNASVSGGSIDSQADGEDDDDLMLMGVAPDTCICCRCKEQCEWANSSAYGRDPFKRSCNQCGSSYRTRLNIIAKEKKASPNGTSNTELFWKKLTEADEVAWYRTQKEKQTKYARRAASIAPDVVLESKDDQKLTKGRRRINCLLTFSKFQERGRQLGNNDADIAEEWKALVRNPAIERESINVGGTMQLALEFFDRVEIYTDEAEEQTWRQTKRRKIDSSEDLPFAIEEQRLEFEAARRGGQMQVGNAVDHQPMVWDNRIANNQVEPHELPVPRESVDSVIGPTMTRPSTDQLMRTMQKQEQSNEELAEEVKTMSTLAEAQKVKENAAAEKRKTVVNQRALIAAKGQAQSQRLSITSKVDALEVEADTTCSMMLESTLPDRVAEVDAVKKACQTAKEEAERAKTEYDEKMKDFDVPGICDQQLKEIKAGLRLIVSKFVAQDSIFKTTKYRVDAATKAINSHLRQMNRQEKKTALATSVVENAHDWSENPTAAAVLTSKPTDRHVYELSAGLPTNIDTIACAVKIPALQNWVERMRSGTYLKTQRAFLTNWVKKNPSHTSQECPITVKLLHTELDEIVGKAVQGKFCDLARPTHLASDKQLKECGWAKGFIPSIQLSSHHSHTGIAAYGLGELIFGLEGQLGLIYPWGSSGAPWTPGFPMPLGAPKGRWD